MILATLALSLLPWQTTHTRTVTPSWCNPVRISLPAMPADATWVVVDIATDSHWWFGVEGLYHSDMFGYMSWDYGKRGRLPYPSEVGQPGDGFELYDVRWGDIPLATRKVFADVGHCLTSIGTEPVGPYDDVLDYDGSHPDGTGSGGWTQDRQRGETLGWTSCRRDVLRGLKAGDDLLLDSQIWSYNVMSASGAGSFESQQSVTISVTWGSGDCLSPAGTANPRRIRYVWRKGKYIRVHAIPCSCPSR